MTRRDLLRAAIGVPLVAQGRRVVGGGFWVLTEAGPYAPYSVHWSATDLAIGVTAPGFGRVVAAAPVVDLDLGRVTRAALSVATRSVTMTFDVVT